MPQMANDADCRADDIESKAEMGGRLPTPPASRCRNEREGPELQPSLAAWDPPCRCTVQGRVDGTADGFGLGLQEVRSGPGVEPAPMAPRSIRQHGMVALDLGGGRLVGLVNLEEGSVTGCGVGVLRLALRIMPIGLAAGPPVRR